MVKHRLLAATAISAALLTGGAAGAVLASPAVSWSQDGPRHAAEPGDGDRPGQGRDRDCDRGRRLRPRPGLGAAAEALGLEIGELRTRLRDGATIADVAGEEGVEVQAVIDAMVTRVTEALDRAVADDKLSPERADAIKAKLTDRIADIVNDGYRRDRDRPGR